MTDALMLTRDNIADVIDAKAMMCVHGDAGVGKTFSVNASLRELAADTVCRVQFRARPLRCARCRRGTATAAHRVRPDT
ncbi:hypothetical protein ACFWB0_02820 [Rhodococcus sp. NPDC060086]|uniref:hypothetical protein n=1 Tax=unclassified Rhodococcus (in: high G+C Gram-positive bacteria) TaxID=192944 RepID=UPI00365D381A